MQGFTLLTYGGGHTGSDAFLNLPDEHIAFLADLLSIQVQLWLPDGDAAIHRRLHTHRDGCTQG